MNKKIIFSVLVSLILMILAGVSVSALVDANLTVGSTVNNSILAGTVKLNFTIVSTLTGENVTTVNYTFTRVDGPGILPILFCTNGTVGTSRNNITECTNNTITSLPDGIYNITISAYNESTNATFGRLIVSNVSVENWGPRVNITSPGANGTQLTDASFINREFEINFTLIDNVAANNRTAFCELRVTKQAATSNNISDLAVNSLTIFNKTLRISNGTNVTFKVPSKNILLNGSQSSYQVYCRNSEQVTESNKSLAQNLTVSDTVLPNNVTSPTFKNSNDIVKTKFEFGDTVTISDCSGTDNTDEDVQYNITIRLPGLTSFTVQNISLSFEDTQALGTYQVNCSASDSNGNINSSLSEFEIIRKVRENERIETEKPKATIIVAPGTTSEVTLSLQGEARLMTEDSAISFTFKGTSHTLKVIDVSSSEVEIEINSDPIKFRMKKGETREVDLDSDGINDMSVTVNTLISKKADIVVNLLTQRSKETTGERKEVTIPSRATREISDINWTLILVVIIIIIVLVLILYYFKNRGSGKVNFNSKDLGGREDITPYQPPAGYKFPGQ